MAASTWTRAERATFDALFAKGLTARRMTEHLPGKTVDCLDGAIRRKKKGGGPRPEKPIEEGMTREGSGDVEVLTARSRTIRTLADLLKTAQVDLALWEVERHVVNKWDSAAKVDGRIQATELYQVKAWLRRRVPKTIADASAALMARMARHAPKYPKLSHLAKVKDPHLLVLGLFDAHFGKLAWGRETGENYDLKLAEQAYRRAGEDLLAKARGFPLERILLPVGQDFFHIDTPGNTTTAGTPQDTDGRLAKIFKTGVLAVVGLIDHLLPAAPVEVLWVPGNHDTVLSLMLCETLQAWYRQCARVTVDTAPAPRKAVEWGCNLLGFTHGNEEKHSSLPGILAGSWPAAWGRTTCREVLLGHWHKTKQTHYVAADTHDGVVVRVLPSLAGTDAWHYRKGFVNNPRAAQAFLYSKTRGYAGHFQSNVMEGGAA